MNPVTNQPPPPPPQTLSTCPRHPDNTFSGICPSCLLERLSTVDQPHQVNVSQQEDMSDLENDILQMEAKIDSIVDNLKSMNDHIDLVHLGSTSPSKKSNFWSTSGWTKKWKNWRRKHNKTRNDIVSEDAGYGFGRRSCDMGPRFSLDAGRVSGSWDRYLVGRSFPKLGDENVPGGSTQTREYYLNSSSRRGKGGLERSNSMVVDNSGSGSVSNAKVSHASEYYNDNHNHKHRRLKFHSIGGEKELVGDDGSVKKQRWWNLKLKVWGSQISSKNGEFGPKLSRSNSMVETGNNKCQGDEFVSERSPNRASNGLLGFYLTPLRGSRRSATGKGTLKSNISSKG